MRICVWITEHEIARTVGQAAYDGLRAHGHDVELCQTVPAEHLNAIGDINIGYGVLRNMDAVWRKSEHDGKPWFCIDRGYLAPGHYDGYYRISLRGTQQCGGWPAPDYERWERLGLTIEEPVKRPHGHTLVCPPTDYVEQYFGGEWMVSLLDAHPFDCIIRKKDCNRPLDDDLNGASRVITFNSSVGWEALRRGIPCESDPVHSIVGAWAKTHDLMATRRELFSVMSACQMTLDEMRGGMLWPLMEKLLEKR